MDIHPDSSSLEQGANHAIATQLSQAVVKYRRFFNSLNSSSKILFSFCDWWIVSDGQQVELVIHCLSGNVRARLMQRLWAIAVRLNRLFGPCQIQIRGDGYPFITSTTQVIHYHEYWKQPKQ